MHTEDVLSATRMGLWRWESATGATSLDSVAAQLLGLSVRRDGEGTDPGLGGGVGIAAEGDWAAVALSEPAFRSRIHVVDYVELQAIATLVLAEQTLAEALVRVVVEDSVLRTIRIRMLPQGEGDTLALTGTVAEVPDTSTAWRPTTADWRRSRETFLLDTGRALSEARSTPEVLRVATSLAMPGFTPDGLAVFSLHGDQLTLVGSQGQRPVPQRLQSFIEMSVDAEHPAAKAVRSGRAVYVATRQDYARRFPASWPLAEPFGRQSWAFLPLTSAGHTTGAWMAAFHHPVAFTPDERSVLTTVAQMLAQALARTTVHETERELAAGLQRTMKPAHEPDITGLTVAARYVPTGGGLQVGGDWYDVIPLPSGRTALVIGDVQGHDVRAAGIMAQLRIALRAYAAEGHPPDAVLARASRFLSGMGRSQWPVSGADSRADRSPDGPPGDSIDGPLDGSADDSIEDRFATCLYIEADPVSGTLDVARAGHPDPALWLADGTMLIRSTAGGLPLGVEPDSDYPTSRLVLEPGETLLVCTDGLLETGGHTMETGWRRIAEIFDEQAEGSGAPEDMEELADALVHSVQVPPAHRVPGTPPKRREDDIALLLLGLDPRYTADRLAARAGVARRTVLTVHQAEADQIGEARHQLQGMLFDWGTDDQIDGAVLMLSEMLTNVLLHTDGDARMVAECSGTRPERLLRVEVADNSDSLPHRRTPGELASSGRGLVMMEMLAGAWGVDPRGEGKLIWFELRENESPPQWA
ncbi:MAG: ATP-binding SpoIIE family protein phosphatase [Streptomyces sp.]|uniref:ATP-binding SpoIIE family protein phosphatase n=1 Tax=Streptomyces sp. TaxID=1931 RepID=UPI003D6A78FC